MRKLLLFLLLLIPSLAWCQVNTARMISGINAQTGTTYTFAPTDVTKIVTFNNTASVAVTLPATSTTGFGVGAIFAARNLGAGVVTITSSSLISGAASIQLFQGQSADIYSSGTTYVHIGAVGPQAGSAGPQGPQGPPGPEGPPGVTPTGTPGLMVASAPPNGQFTNTTGLAFDFTNLVPSLNRGSITSDINIFNKTWTANNPAVVFHGIVETADYTNAAPGSFFRQFCPVISNVPRCMNLDMFGNLTVFGSFVSGGGTTGVAGSLTSFQGILPQVSPNSIVHNAPASVPTAYRWQDPSASCGGSLYSNRFIDVDGAPTMPIQCGTGSTSAIATKTANYTVLSTDHTILCNATETITLPTTNIFVGQEFVIKDIGAAITCTVSSSVNIDGATSFTINTQFNSTKVQWDGTQYWKVD